MRNRLVLKPLLPALAVASMLVVAGCGGKSAAEKRTEFLTSANAVCNQYETLQNAVRFPTVNPLSATLSHRDRARWGLSLKQVVDYGRQEVKSLRALHAPGDLDQRFQEMVATKSAAFEQLAVAADAAKRNHRTQIKAPVDGGKVKLARVSTLAKELQLPRCA